ncbi:MAG: HEAT repeat domain-containing protein [Planctomycetota bacterium]|nr:MAG: HEAT repeat domain-containing protein [Planctomycetota bacterium]
MQLRRFGFPPVLLALAACWPGCAAAGPDKDKPYVLEEYSPPPGRGELSTGQLIFECERHLGAWQRAMAAQRSPQNREDIQGIELALRSLAHREQKRLEEQAMSGQPRNRAVASAALGFTREPEVLSIIANNVADPDPMVAANALLGIGVLALPETPIRPIHEAVLRPTATQDVRRNATFAAFQIAQKERSDRDGTLAAIFAVVLDNPDPTVRAQAAAGLGLARAAHMAPPVAELLANDPDAQVRTAAAYALGEIGAPGSAAALVKALKDRDKLTAGTARASLVKLHGRDEGPDPGDWERALGLD